MLDIPQCARHSHTIQTFPGYITLNVPHFHVCEKFIYNDLNVKPNSTNKNVISYS